MFVSPGEICFSIFGIDIYYYGIIMGIAVLFGVCFANFVRKKYYADISENDFYNTVLIVLIFGFIGARLYYCIFNSSYYSHHLLDILNFREGGLSIHGGLIFGFISAVIFTLIKKLPLLKLADLFSYGLILAQSIGRWGNFFNSEAFGKPTNIFCKLFIPIENRPPQYIDYSYFHPTFLYESLLDFLIFIILVFVIRKLVKNYSGFVFLSYLILYSLARILVETIRIDSIFTVFGLPLPIFVSLIIILFAIIGITILLKKYNIYTVNKHCKM